MPDLEESAPVEDTQNLAAADTSAGKSNFESLPPHLETKWDEIRSTSPLKQRRSSLDRLFDWSEHLDESSGAYWYYNNCTEAIEDANAEQKDECWSELPSDTATNWEQLAVTSPLRRVVGVWEEHYDPKSDCYWYYNTETYESTWQQPGEWADIAVHTQPSDGVDAPDNAREQYLSKGWPHISGDNNSTNWDAVGIVSPAESSNTLNKNAVWHKMMDPVTQCPWWYNNSTGEKTWQ